MLVICILIFLWNVAHEELLPATTSLGALREALLCWNSFYWGFKIYSLVKSTFQAQDHKQKVEPERFKFLEAFMV